MKNRPVTLLVIATALIVACSCPLVTATGVTPPGTAATSTASPAPGATALSTSTIPLAAPNGQPLNCRSGPGVDWAVVVVLNPGQTAEIVGQSPDGSWWYVKNPSLPGTFCWISTSFAATSGNLSGIPVVAVPSPAASPVPSAGVVTAVSVSVKPTKIQVPGCIGPIQPSTVSGSVTVSGPVKLELHFESQQNGSLSGKSLNFKTAGTKGVDDSFTPPVIAGSYKVELVIKGFSTAGMDSVAYYTISC